MVGDEEKCLLERLHKVRERLADAARASGRAPESVRLTAVSKFHSARAVATLAAAGQIDFGESYVQEALAKQDELSRLSLRWHMVGHVQGNKAGLAAGRFFCFHSLDSLKLARALDKRALETGRRERVLIQVNVGSEEQKSGVAPGGLAALAEALMGLEGIEAAGLMCLPPFFDDGERARPYFALLRKLCEDLRRRLGLALPELSMGMSGDFAQAVAEGSTCVRIGTEIFGSRPARVP